MDERASPVDSQLESSGSAPPRTRLGVGHLMLWTLCSAVYLAVSRVISALLSDMEGVYATPHEASSLAYSIVSGAELGGALALIVSRIRRGRPLLSQPGHWLLFVGAIFTLIYMPTMIAMLSVGGQYFLNGDRFFLVFGTEALILPIAFAIGAKREKTRRWRILFAILSALTLTQSLFYFGLGIQGGVLSPWVGIASSIAMIGNPILACVLLLVSAVERIGGQRRDWLHWTGVVTYAAAAALTIFQIYVAA